MNKTAKYYLTMKAKLKLVSLAIPGQGICKVGLTRPSWSMVHSTIRLSVFQLVNGSVGKHKLSCIMQFFPRGIWTNFVFACPYIPDRVQRFMFHETCSCEFFVCLILMSLTISLCWQGILDIVCKEITSAITTNWNPNSKGILNLN